MKAVMFRTGTSKVELEATMPSLFTRNEGTSKSVSNARDFFTKVSQSQGLRIVFDIYHAS